MKKSKNKVFNVMSTAALTSLFFSSFTVFAESNDTSPPSQTMGKMVEQGRPLFFNKDKGETNKDDLYSKDFKKEGSAKPYNPSDVVRLIVEVEQPTEIDKNAKNKKTLYKQKQDKVIDEISKKNKSKSKSPTKVKHRFFEGFSGFSLETEFQNIKDIQSAPGVTNVHIANTFQPTMGASKELVQAQKVWNKYGYKGEGLLVAVVDSGIDYTHKDMKLPDKAKEKEKWTQASINTKFQETEVNEVWYTDKVPTGYDWADNDTNVIPGPEGSSHGTHVAGTVGASGDETNGGVEGIAPGVQLLAEKVFSDIGGGAYEDDIIAGIEHAIIMGADVINMSLGVDAGFVSEEDDPIQKAVRAATENGTLVVAAAGNASYSTKNNLIFSSLKPYAENPDIGVVGAPSVSPYAVSVASYENSKIHFNTLADVNGYQLPYQDQTQYNFKLSKSLSPNQGYDLVYVGNGLKKADYLDQNGQPKVKDKIAVVKLEEQYSHYSTFQFDAERYGKAIAVIIIPPDNMADYPYLGLSPYSIPAATTGKAVGQDLINKLTSGQTVQMKLSGGTWVGNAKKDSMSDFSSNGSPHTLDFKPEISAPGGNIYSTVPGNDYEVMSGTSMATPHVAGGSALLLQALYERGLPHSESTVLKAKLALMNTANVVMDPRTNGAVPYSPRVQGSGLMQIKNAIHTPVIVTSRNTPLEQAGAVALKEMGQNTSFKLNVEAFDTPKGNKDDIEYQVYVDVLKDKTEMKEFDLDNDGSLDSKEYLTLTSERINGVNVTVNDKKVTQTDGTSIKIKPGQTKMLTVNISLPDSLKKNSFVEGFVRLVPVAKDQDKAVPLSIPYMGFYGKWDKPQNIDPAAWEKDAFLGYTALWDDTSERYPMGYDPATGRFNPNHIAFSPNFFANGVYSTFTALRNLQKTEMYVEDQSGNIIQNLGDFSEYTGKPWKFAKNIMAYGDYGIGGYLWDMKDKSGQFVPDGVYQYVIKTTLDYTNAKPQTVKMPIKVDSTAPTISDIQVTPKDGTYEISFKAKDNENGSDFLGAVLWVDGQYKDIAPGETSLIVNNEPESVVVLAADYAYNQSYAVWGDPSYVNQNMIISFIYVSPTQNIKKNNPAQIISYASNRIDWTINIKDGNGKIVDSFEVKNEHTLRTQWTPNSDLPDGTYYMSVDLVTKSGLKATTQPEQITVRQQP
ncbi:S8 family serine peptidase [Priestia megaterium]|uniref:S8 family serine peptidase n=1 Tax=Priestia megaterium TaxID=1404 RepID=A0A6H1NX90_PRIMG|nr:S8 family serine peptidase [Priestia megaterium]QIZ05909.1 S8 family serine peptidase [Priestia megaterium]